MASNDDTRRRPQAQFSGALMSDTKWRKLIDAAVAARLPIDDMVVKFVDVDEPRRMRFPPSLAIHHAYMDTIEYGPVEFREIEWLELAADLEPLLSALGRFPIERLGRASRVLGYRV